MTRPSFLDPSTPLATLRRVFGHRLFPVAAGVLAAALTLPSLANGLLPDDMIHRALLLEEPQPDHLADLPWFADPEEKTLGDKLQTLFVFVEPEITGPLMDAGLVPWWTDPELRVSFFRPVAALTHVLDYALWPDSFALMHFHSVLWYGLAAGLAALFFRRMAGAAWPAGLAALIFAADAAHVTPATWIANRNALIALCFGLGAVILHDRWRRGGFMIGTAAAPVLFLAALFSAEAGAAAGAFLAAYALCLDRGPWLRRLASLAPYVAAGIIWLLVYQALGHGAAASAMYTDPTSEPARYAAAVAERAPILLAGQWGYADPRNYNLLSEPAALWAWVGSAAVLVLAAAILWPLLRRDRAARFFGLGMILALSPICGMSLTSGRHLVFVGVGSAGLMAVFVAGMLDRAGWKPRSTVWRAAAWALLLAVVLIHVAAAPIRLAVKSHSPFAGKADQSIAIEEGKELVIVNSPNPGQFFQLFVVRHCNGLPLPARSHVLAPGYYDVALCRADEQTIEVRPEHGFLVPPGRYPVAAGKKGMFHPAYLFQHLENGYRSDCRPMEAGDRVDLDGASVEVVELTPDGRPATIRVRFDRALEDPELQWFRWDWAAGNYFPFAPPDIGESVVLPGL